MLEIKNFSVKAKNNRVLLKDISMKIDRGKVIGLTGASGSGKTTLLKSIMGTLDKSYNVMGGSICLDSENISSLKAAERRKLCGKTIGYIPQNPMTAFDPRIKICKQVEETLCVRLGVKKYTASKMFLEILKMLNLEDEKRVVESYPSEISGGMLQRIAVALVFALNPKYILADEPTSALDEENRDILIKILKSKQDKIGILLVSHDVNTISSLCDNVFVIEDGKIIEEGKMEDLLMCPKMDWTKTFSEIYRNAGGRSFTWTKY